MREPRRAGEEQSHAVWHVQNRIDKRAQTLTDANIFLDQSLYLPDSLAPLPDQSRARKDYFVIRR